MNNYVFPFQLVNKGADIILYGAGNVGTCFYKQVLTSGYANIVAWVDKRHDIMQKKGFPVSSLEVIKEYAENAYIVISIENHEVAYSVSKELKNRYNISKERIIWSEKYRFSNDGLFVDQEQERKYGLSEELKKISPYEMLHSFRLDLAVRYLVARDIVFGIENPNNLSLYSRMILARTNAHENDEFYFDTKRNNTHDYIDSIKKLCCSIKEKGYLQEGYIPVGENNVFLNGAHRIATALALEEDIWISHFAGKKGKTDFSIEWFDKNGFSTDDKIRVLRAYADLYTSCGIIILFAPCMDLWDYLEKQISKEMTIVGGVELDFSDNYIAFENLFRDMYSDPLWRNVYIDRKLDLLKTSELKMRVLLVSNEGFENRDLYKTIENTKLELRDRLLFDTDIAPVVMHGSNSKTEFIHLKKIVLSVNNLKQLRRRVVRCYSEEFVNRLERLKEVLGEKDITIEDVIITGSSSWEIFGLRRADDLDFSVAGKYREKYGNDHKRLGNGLDYSRLDSVEVSDNKVYSDELLLSDDNYHFVFDGLKFVNIDLIAQKKAYNKREKDIKDVRLYELFSSFVLCFDDKAVLKKQIEKEFYKKR